MVVVKVLTALTRQAEQTEAAISYCTALLLQYSMIAELLVDVYRQEHANIIVLV